MAGFLQGDVKVPGVKDKLPKAAVAAGVAVTGVAIIIYYRRRQSAGAAAAGPGATGLASGGLPSGVLAGDTAGAFTWDGTYDNPSDPYSMDSSTGQTFGNEGFSGGFGAGLGGGGGGGTGGPPFSSNQQWSAWVLQQDGGEHPNMAEAIGLYLDGRALDADQQDLVYRAQALAGPVPVAGPGGYPPKLRTAASSGKPKGGTTFAANPVKGLKVTPGQGKVTVSWDQAAHATGYQVALKNVTAHRNAGGPVTTAHATFTFTGLKAGDRYEASVLARPAEKGAKPAVIQAAPIGNLPLPKG